MQDPIRVKIRVCCIRVKFRVCCIPVFSGYTGHGWVRFSLTDGVHEPHIPCGPDDGWGVFTTHTIRTIRPLCISFPLTFFKSTFLSKFICSRIKKRREPYISRAFFFQSLMEITGT
jgi:hypothetical protein